MPPGQTPNPPKPPKPAWFEHGTSVWPRCPPGAPGQEEGRDDHPSQSSSLLSVPVPPEHSLVLRFWSVLCHWTFSRPPTLDEAPAPRCGGKKLDLQSRQPGQDVIGFYLPFVPLAALTEGTTRGISGKIYCPFPSKQGQAVLLTNTCKSRGNGVQRG